LYNPLPITPIFGSPYQFTEDEKVLSALLSSQFANFATSFNPNVGSHMYKGPNLWPTFDQASDVIWRYHTPVSSTESGYRKVQCDFWDTIGYEYGNSLLNAIKQMSRTGHL
jgi:carboxylesterase type B